MEDLAAPGKERSAPRPFNVPAAEDGLKEQLLEPQAGVPRHTFESLFCRRFQCPPAACVREAFGRCLYPHARLLAPLLVRFRPDFFADDFRFLELVGEDTSLQEVTAEVRRFHETGPVGTRFLRKTCRLRVSAHKVLHLARELFQSEACGCPAP